MRVFLTIFALLALIVNLINAQTHSFCYTIQNTKANSPYMLWSVQVVGTLTLTPISFTGPYGLPGYQVLSASGTRSVWSQGQAVRTQTITNVLRPSVYNGNDNLLSGTPSNLYLDSTYGGISFQLSSAPVGAAGVPNEGGIGSSLNYLSVNGYSYPRTTGAGINEADLPANDGIVNVVSSVWQITNYSSTFTCATAAPAVTIASDQTNLYNTQQIISFCYTFTGGPGVGGNYYTQQIWYTNVQGEWLVSSYGGTVGSRIGYLILGIQNSVRTYIFPNGTSVTATMIGIGGVNAAAVQEGSTLWPGLGTLFLSNNIYYPTWPYLDSYGVTMIADRDIATIGAADTGNHVTRLFIDPATYNVEERQWNPVSGYYYTSTLGSLVVTPSSTRSGTLSTWANQCQPGGTVQWYSYCYTIDGTAQTPPFFEYNYGTFSASPAVTRQGRSAITIGTMNGIRGINVNGVTNTTNIVALEYIREANSLAQSNDNILFTDGVSPLLSSFGLLMLVGGQAVFPKGNAVPQYSGQPYTDILLRASSITSSSSLRTIEYAATNANLNLSSAAFAISYRSISGPSDTTLQTCPASNAIVSQPAIQSYSFCYFMSGVTNKGWSIGVSGQINVYTNPLTVGGRTAYAIHSISGTRTYQDGLGRNSTTPIVGLSSDGFAFYSFYYYDQLLFTTFPQLSVNGLLYKINQPAYTTGGLVYGDQVFNLYYDSVYALNELTIVQTGGALYYSDPLVGSFVALQDGGASQNTILNAQCSYTAGAPTQFSWCYYIESDNSTNPWYVLAYGTLNATGPVTREGRSDAYTIQSLTGVRSVSSSTKSVSQPILYLRKVNEDATIVNDNVLYLSSPHLDSLGFDFALSGNAEYPSKTSTSPFVNAFWDQAGALQYVDLSIDVTDTVETTLSAFNVQQITAASGSQSAVQCQSSDGRVKVPAPKYWEFCYFITGPSGYSVAVSGYLTTMGTPTIVNGRSGYIVTGANGTRSYTSGPGAAAQTQNIVGIQSLTESAYLNGGYDNVIYSAFPYFDNYGVNIITDGQAVGPGGVAFNNVLNIYTSANGDFQELSYTTAYPNGVTIDMGTVVVTPTSNAIANNPSSLLQSQCSSTAGTATTFQFCYSILPQAESGSTWQLYGYGTFVAYGPVEREGRKAYTIASGGVPMKGARISIDGRGIQQYQYIQSVLPIKADLSNASLLNNNVMYTNSPQLDRYGVIFSLSGPATYPSQTSTITARSNEINVYYQSNGFNSGFIDWDADDSNYDFTYNSNFITSVYSASTYPPTSCGIGVSIPTGNWTAATRPANTGTTDNNTGNSNSGSSSDLSKGAIAGIVIGVVFGVIFTCLLCAILYCVASRGKNGKTHDKDDMSASKYNSDVPSQVGHSQVEMQSAEEGVEV